MAQSRLEFGLGDHRRTLFVPLEKVGITADDEVGVVGTGRADHVVVVWVPNSNSHAPKKDGGFPGGPGPGARP